MPKGKNEISKFWKFAEDAARKVSKWPAWKKAGILERSQNKATDKPKCAIKQIDKPQSSIKIDKKCRSGVSILTETRISVSRILAEISETGNIFKVAEDLKIDISLIKQCLIDLANVLDTNFQQNDNI